MRRNNFIFLSATATETPNLYLLLKNRQPLLNLFVCVLDAQDNNLFQYLNGSFYVLRSFTLYLHKFP